MQTTTEEVKTMLLSGRHITKLDLFHESDIHSSCLPQRIYDIRQTTDWDIKSQSVKGKGTLREYWLEQSEIDRIMGVSPKVEEYIPVSEKVAETLNKAPQNEVKEEQMGLGLFGEWW